jgi:ornithine carbamoyltransferase
VRSHGIRFHHTYHLIHELKGKNIALIFEKDSTRTRCAFETAAYDQGAHVTYLIHEQYLSQILFYPFGFQLVQDMSRERLDHMLQDSTRTRCAFETAAYDQGAHVTYLGPTGSQMGKKECWMIFIC